MRRAIALALLSCIPVSMALAAAGRPLEERINFQASVSEIYQAAIEEYRSAGFHVESAPPAMTALRVRKHLMESGHFLIELHGRTGLWTEVIARYEIKKGWFFRRRTLGEPIDLAGYVEILDKIKKRVEREP